MPRLKLTSKSFFILFLILLFLPNQASAHVKWFTDGSYADRPLTIGEIVDQLFIILLVGCIVVISIGVFIDYKISSSKGYIRINNWLEQRKDYGYVVMRVAAAMLLILSWQGDAMLAPTLKVPTDFEWIGWYQFVLAFLLLIPKTTKIAGFGMIGLYGFGLFIFHPFHMFDYFLFVGSGYYLVTRQSKNKKIQNSALSALYISVGLSLSWVALEKLVYPDWSLFLLKTHPNLAMGFNYNFFIVSIAFVEFSLGYLLIVCLLQRPLAVIISIVFFLTTTVFGKVEVIGHTLIHGCLIIFLLEGPGFIYTKITTVFKNIWKRIAANAVIFIVLFFILISIYHLMAYDKYEHKQKFIENRPEHMHAQIEIAGLPKEQLPTIDIDVIPDPMGGYNIKIHTVNFKFTPENVNETPVMGEGHAHLHINGKKTARIYCPWYHIDALPAGTYEISVTLNNNAHEEYVYRGVPIEDKEVIVITGR